MVPYLRHHHLRQSDLHLQREREKWEGGGDTKDPDSFPCTLSLQVEGAARIELPFTSGTERQRWREGIIQYIIFHMPLLFSLSL
eukprot:gene7571-5338_t